MSICNGGDVIEAGIEGGGGSAACFGQSPSTVSVLNVVRNELLGILKRAANRGQILDHCNVELMVEEAMLESNLVQSVDEILSGCNSVSSLHVQNSRLSPSYLIMKNKQIKPNEQEKTFNSGRNNKKIELMSKLSRDANAHVTTNTKVVAPKKNETRYIVKKIIFDGLEEMTYKYVATSGSSSSDDESATTAVTKRPEKILKFIKAPKMVFGNSDSSLLAANANGNDEDLQHTPHGSDVTLVGSISYDGDCQQFDKHLSMMMVARKQNSTQLVPDDKLSIIRMSRICVANTTAKRNVVVAANVKSQNGNMYKTQKLNLNLFNKKLRHIKSCKVVKSMQSLVNQAGVAASSSRNIAKELRKKNQLKIANISSKRKREETTATGKAGDEFRKLKSFVLKKSYAGGSLNASEMRPRLKIEVAPTMKTNSYKSKLSQQTTSDNNKSKSKLGRSKTVMPNEKVFEKTKKSKSESGAGVCKDSATKPFSKQSKSEPDRLRVIKTKLREFKSKETVEVTAKETSTTTSKHAVGVTAKLQPIPVMSKLWQTIKQATATTTTNEKSQTVKNLTAQLNAKSLQKVGTLQTLPTASTPIVVMSKLCIAASTASAKRSPKQQFAMLIQCNVEEDNKQQDEHKTNSSKPHLTHTKSFLDEAKNRRLIAFKTRNPLTPDLQTKMLTAEWLSIAKQLKREEGTTKSSVYNCSSPAFSTIIDNDKWKFHLQKKRQEHEKVKNLQMQMRPIGPTLESSSEVVPVDNGQQTTKPKTVQNDNEKQSKNKFNWCFGEASDTNVIRLKRNVRPLTARNSSASQHKKLKVRQIVNFKKKSTIFQRKDDFMRTVEAMSFLLYASDTVKTIDGGLDEQDLLKFRWNVEYQKREEAKRKAGKYDAATTMLTNIAGPPSTEVQTQTDSSQETITILPQTATKADQTVDVVDETIKVQALNTVPTATPTPTMAAPTKNEIDQKFKSTKVSKPQLTTSDKVINEQQQHQATVTDNEQQKATKIPPPPPSAHHVLTFSELELLSKDYFSALLDEIRELLETTTVLSEKAFSSKPLSLRDVRQAARKVVQLRVVKSSLIESRFYFFVNIEKALQKQIEIMKTIVAYGKMIYPNDFSTDTAEEEAQLLRLLHEYQQKTMQQPMYAEEKSNYYKNTSGVLSNAPQIRTDRRRPTQTEFINQYNFDMLRRARLEAQIYQQQQEKAFQQTHIEDNNSTRQTFLKRTSSYSTKKLKKSAPTHAHSESRQHMASMSCTATTATMTTAKATRNVASPHDLDYISDMSSEYVRQKRNNKITKHKKKIKQPPPKPSEFQLSGFKDLNKSQSIDIRQVHRRYYEQRQQQRKQQQSQQQLEPNEAFQTLFSLSSSATPTPSASASMKRTKKFKMNLENSLPKKQLPPQIPLAPPTVRVPAKNAPYTRTSYVLPVPANHPTCWELFKWNCGRINDGGNNVRARFYAESMLNAHERLKNKFARNELKSLYAYGYQTTTHTPPIWK